MNESAVSSSSPLFDASAVGKVLYLSDSSGNAESDDPLKSNDNDAILNRGGLRPFPMSSQDRETSTSTKPPSSSSVSSTPKRESQAEEESGKLKKRRKSDE